MNPELWLGAAFGALCVVAVWALVLLSRVLRFSRDLIPTLAWFYVAMVLVFFFGSTFGAILTRDPSHLIGLVFVPIGLFGIACALSEAQRRPALAPPASGA